MNAPSGSAALAAVVGTEEVAERDARLRPANDPGGQARLTHTELLASFFKARRQEAMAARGKRNPAADDGLAPKRQPRAGSFSDVSVERYTVLWEHWVRWLQEKDPNTERPRAPSYAHATPELVRQFLEQGRSTKSRANWRRLTRPGTGAASDRTVFAPKEFKNVELSEVTQRRYWANLKRIYDHAMEKGIVLENPTDLRGEALPEAERTAGVSVDQAVWRALPKCLDVTEDWLTLRDRAVVLVMMDAAITPGEACSLELPQVSFPNADGRLTLMMNGERAAQKRELELGAAASEALEEWLYHRKRMVRVAKGAETLVFLSLRRTPLSRMQLHVLVSKALRAAHARVRREAAKYSPMVLRNTRIVMRIAAGESAARVAYDAGFADVRSFRGLEGRIKDAMKAAKTPTELREAFDHAMSISERAQGPGASSAADTRKRDAERSGRARPGSRPDAQD